MLYIVCGHCIRTEARWKGDETERDSEGEREEIGRGNRMAYLLTRLA